MLYPPPSVCITHIQRKKEKSKKKNFKKKQTQLWATLFQARFSWENIWIQINTKKLITLLQPQNNNVEWGPGQNHYDQMNKKPPNQKAEEEHEGSAWEGFDSYSC